MLGIDDAAAAMMLSGAMSTAGSLYANQNNAALARSQLDYQKFVNDVNWAIAAENNATQIDMANTAHQREVADLRRAGLNPILSAGGNGASVPSLTTPSGHVIGAGSPYSNPLEGAASSARSLSRFFGQQYQAGLDKLRADASYAESDAASMKAQARSEIFENELAAKQALFDLEAWNEAHGIYSEYDSKTGKNVEIIKDLNRYRMMKELRAEGIESGVRDTSNVNWRNNLGAFTGAARDVATSASSLGLGVGRLRHATKLLRATRSTP